MLYSLLSIYLQYIPLFLFSLYLIYYGMYVLIIFKVTHLPSLHIFSHFISSLIINTFLFAEISSDFLIYLLFYYFMFRSEYFRVLLNCGMSESLSKSHSESRYSQNHGNRRAIVDIVVPGLSIV